MTAKAMTRSSDNLVWIDCEMTGLDPEKEVIIEIAAIITSSDLDIIAEAPGIAVLQDEVLLRAMDRWNKKQHAKSGLLERVRASKTTTDMAEREILKFVKKHCVKGQSPLCGNSIGHDRRFLVKYMPGLHAYFHYQSIDVSSFKQVVNRWYGSECRPPDKKSAHLALQDIRDSIEELKHYRNVVFKQQGRRTDKKEA